MILLIDAGNTRIKWAWSPQLAAEDHAWQVHALTHTELAQGASQALALQQAALQAEQVWLSNVAGSAWLKSLSVPYEHWHVVTPGAQALGVSNHYQHPSQLGSDRWCSLLAVWHLFHQPALVATAGTALTIDVLAEEGSKASFIGGTIQPGLQLMWHSLQQGTAQLDYTTPAQREAWSGVAQNSQQAMWLGCTQALASSVALQFAQWQPLWGPHPLLVLTGGDAALIRQYLPDPLAAQAIIVDNLVLKGLACLAAHTDE